MMEEGEFIIKLSNYMESINHRVLKFFQDYFLKKEISENFIINKPDYLADEAFFLMEEFFKQFKIEKGYLDIDKYFNPLPKLTLKHLWNLFTFNLPKNKQKPLITIAHMIEVAKRKEWFDPQ